MPNLFQEAKNTKEIYQEYRKEYKKSLRSKYMWNQLKFDILSLSARGIDTLIIMRPINNDITGNMIKKLKKYGFHLDIKYLSERNKEEIHSIKIKW